MAKHTIFSASYLILIKDQKTLLLRRAGTGWQDGMYSLVAGHLDPDESPMQCMVREAHEEAGISIDITDLNCSSVIHRRTNDREYIDFFFTCSTWVGTPTNMEPNKCDNLAWFSFDDLPDNTLPYIKDALNDATLSTTQYREITM